MNVRKPIITSLISLATLAPCKAQKAIQFATETGITGDINKELLYYGGTHAQLTKGRLNTDLSCGFIVDNNKTVTFESELENDFSWTKTISSWVRETFHLSKNETNLSSEIAPIKINKSFNKFDTSIAPTYVIQNDFRENEIKQGAGIVFNTTYSINSHDALGFEATYSSEPAKNLFKTHFGKLKDNISYMVSYMRKF